MLVIMAINGLGVGLIFAVVPGLVLGAVASSETASAMGFNQVLRYVGYSVGSALSGLVLEMHTPDGAAFPEDAGYTQSGLLSAGMWIVTFVVTIVLPERRRAVAHTQSALDAESEELLAEESLADAESSADAPAAR